MNAIKALRERAGLTQKQLGELLGLGQSTVAMWETDESKPRADKLPELARVLGCTIEDLYGSHAVPPTGTEGR